LINTKFIIYQYKMIQSYPNETSLPALVGLPPKICGPLLPLYRGNYNESKLGDIIINKKKYKIDTYGNVTGFKNCVFLYDSAGYLEEIGIFENNSITEYT